MDTKKLTVFRRAAALALAASVLAGLLSGCRRSGKTQTLSEYVYVPGYVNLPKTVTEMNNTVLSGDTIYYTSGGYVHEDGTPASQSEIDAMNGAAVTSEAGKSAPALILQTDLWKVKKDGTGLAKLADYRQKQLAKDTYSYASVDRVAVGTNGDIWTAEEYGKTVYDLPKGFDTTTQDPSPYYKGDEHHLYVRRLSASGAEQTCLDLGQGDAASGEGSQKGNSSYISDMRVAKDGTAYLADSSNNNLYAVSPAGSFSSRLRPRAATSRASRR